MDATSSPDPEARFAAAADRVLRYVRLRLGRALRRRHEPVDVLQETLLAAWRVFDRFEDRGPDSFVRWLCRIAETTILKLSEREGAEKRTPPGEAEPISRILDRVRAGQTGPVTAAARAEERAGLDAAIEALPDVERSALLGRYFLGLTFSELAEREGIPESTVRRIVGRATRLVGKELAG